MICPILSALSFHGFLATTVLAGTKLFKREGGLIRLSTVFSVLVSLMLGVEVEGAGVGSLTGGGPA